MNKYAFLIYHQEYEAFLSLLQSLGVVHISRKRKPQEEDKLKAILDERLYVRHLLKQLRAWLPDGAEVIPSEHFQEDLSHKVSARLSQLEERSNAYLQKSDLVEAQRLWGEFDPEQVQALAQRGYRLVAYTISSALYSDDYQQTYNTIPIAKEGVLQYFIRLEDLHTLPCPDAEQQQLPTQRLSTLIQEQEHAKQELEKYELALREDALGLSQELSAYDLDLEDQFAFGAALLQGSKEANDKLIFVEGWIPSTDAEALEAKLQETGYYYQACEIQEEDSVPISLQNNIFNRGFELITKMFSLPNYREIDQTALFAPFFMLFFGLCMGDAGYGLIVFAISTYLHLKAKKGEDTAAYELMQWLGGAAFFVGLLMGSFFGDVLPYADHKDYFLNQDNLMILSIAVGLLQILFAKGVAAYKIKMQQGTKYALAPFAWIIFLIAIGLVIAIPYISFAIPTVVLYTLYAIVGLSTLIILFYSAPGKGPIVSVGSALWKTYETASGLLGDTLSYIRLFAIGLTGAVLGGVFNSLAIEQTASLPLLARLPLMLLILLAGHSINIALAMIGALVHPIRLTFVEYYKNSEFEGGGVAYEPLKHSKTTNN